MKNLINGVFFLALVGIILIGCKKENNFPVDEKEEPKEELQISKKSLNIEDSISISFSNINTYLVNRNADTDGEFFEFTTNNPNFSWAELEYLGYVDLDYLYQEFNKIQEAANGMEDSEINQIAESSVNPDFIGQCDLDCPNPEPPVYGICIFCCRGCLDGIKKNHCITIIAWDFGPGC